MSKKIPEKKKESKFSFKKNTNNFFSKTNIKIFLLIFFLWTLINAYSVFHPYFLPSSYEIVDEEYKTQIYQDDFSNFVNEKKEKVRKITFPWADYLTYFEILVEDENNQKVLKSYQVYRNPDEDWNINFKNYQEYTGLGFYTQPENTLKKILIDIVISIVPLIFFIWLIFFAYKKMWLLPPNIWGWNKISHIRKFNWKEDNKVTFDEIWWISSIKDEILDLVDTLKNFKKFRERGVRPVRWILFEGPPWVWKTMIAKAIASTLGIDMFIATWNDFKDMFVWQGAKKVHSAFEHIKKELNWEKDKIAILFIDEIDTVFKKRGTDRSSSEWDSIVNAFLHEIDWINWTTNIVVIWATNHISVLDDALISRMDKSISFKYPTRSERLDIIQRIMSKIKKKDKALKLSPKLDYNILAWNTMYQGWRELEIILNETHRQSVKNNLEVTNELIQTVFADTLLWKDNKWVDVNSNDKDIVTYHELGHWVIWFLNWKQVHTITIIPKWPALGITWSLDREEKVLRSKDDILKEIQQLIAWREAEKIWIWDISTWASNDYERATKLAFSYFTDYNFDYKDYKIWYILNDKSVNNWIYQSEILKEVWKKVVEMISDQEKIVEKVLNKYKKNIENLAIILKEKEVISEVELEKEFNFKK